MSSSIKVSDENYRWLCKIAAKLQIEREKPASFDEAITYLKKRANIKNEK